MLTFLVAHRAIPPTSKTAIRQGLLQLLDEEDRTVSLLFLHVFIFKLTAPVDLQNTGALRRKDCPRRL
jgi:hypothetical protein